MRIYLKSIGIGVVLLAGVLQAQWDQITAERIKAHVRFLAHDLLEGRGVGTRGGELTEEYLATTLASFGVKPGGENRTYFQTVPMVGISTQPESGLAATGPGGEVVRFRWQDEFVGGTHRQEPQVDFEAEAVFAGHGIVSPAENWDDYKGVSVRGKIVVVFTNEPQPDNPQVFKGKTLTYAGRWTFKLEEAARQGALGCVIIHTTPTAGYGWEVVRNSWSKEDPQMKLDAGRYALAFSGWLTEQAGNRLLALSDLNVAELLKAADSRDFRPIPLKTRFKGTIRSKIRQITSRNVFGIIEGTDPQRRDEMVMFSAHWDHLGVALPANGDAIYNGAIDNATGCAVVLEQARVFSTLQQKPRRSIVFAFWTAEESGLRGAEYYAMHPLYPPDKTAVNINYDALFPSGRTRDAVVTGAERTNIWPIVQEAASRFELELAPDPRPEQGSFYRSDHFMLARIGVPAFRIGLGTKIYGKPDDFAEAEFREFNTKRYHQPGDEFREDWDFASLEYAARFGFLIGLNVANSDIMPEWNAGDEFAIAKRSKSP